MSLLKRDGVWVLLILVGVVLCLEEKNGSSFQQNEAEEEEQFTDELSVLSLSLFL